MRHARTPQSPQLFVGANAETFGYWAERAIEQTRLRFSGDERLLFVRSWNEWDATCRLEPDRRHERQYLEALRAAVLRTSDGGAAETFMENHQRLGDRRWTCGDARRSVGHNTT